MDFDEILEHLDVCQGGLLFLANDGRQHIADARLTVFRSTERWAVFIELPNFSTSEDAYVNWIGGAGTSIDDGYLEDASAGHELFQQLEDAPLARYGAINGRDEDWYIERGHFSITLNGQRLDFAPSDAEYADAGIKFCDGNAAVKTIEPGCLLRFLCYHLNHPFFATEAELRSLMEDSGDMEIFLQTRHWRHPVYLIAGWNDDDFFEKDLIRKIPCFQVLARAIASGDLTEWNTQDTREFNTHWEALQAIRDEALQPQRATVGTMRIGSLPEA